MNYKDFNLCDWIGHISGAIEDERELDGNEMRDLVEFLSILKQKSCVDAISRQAVKEQMIKYGFHAPDMTVTEFVEDVLSVNPQEPKTGHWTLVSERVPEENGYYLTTTMYHEVYCDYWEEDRFNRTEAVTAWMPLPKPYVPDTNIGKMSEIPTEK